MIRAAAAAAPRPSGYPRGTRGVAATFGRFTWHPRRRHDPPLRTIRVAAVVLATPPATFSFAPRYVEAEGDDADAAVYEREGAEGEGGDDGGDLLSVEAQHNTLSIVLRDPGTLRFVKFVSTDAPGSRWDVELVCDLHPDDLPDPDASGDDDSDGSDDDDPGGDA